jgi:hypothetical protein
MGFVNGSIRRTRTLSLSKGDIIPALLEKKYLKTIYSCHECAGNLDKAIDPNDGDSYLQLDFEVGR